MSGHDRIELVSRRGRSEAATPGTDENIHHCQTTDVLRRNLEWIEATYWCHRHMSVARLCWHKGSISQLEWSPHEEFQIRSLPSRRWFLAVSYDPLVWNSNKISGQKGLNLCHWLTGNYCGCKYWNTAAASTDSSEISTTWDSRAWEMTVRRFFFSSLSNISIPCACYYSNYWVSWLENPDQKSRRRGVRKIKENRKYPDSRVERQDPYNTLTPRSSALKSIRIHHLNINFQQRRGVYVLSNL